ncbi:MAG: hypothetical protein EGQ73_04850 [Clostridiales bacterium]|nr:hypothetical protein [Clostridiales bacterium]
MSASAKASRASLVIRSMKRRSTSVLLFCVYKDCEARKGRCEAKKQPGAVSAAVCVSASAKASRASLVIRSMKKKKHFGASFFVLIRIARLEKAVAKQRNSRGLFRRPCACRRARKRAERVS